MQYAIDNDILLLCFPPHSTHLLQPLDVGLFFPLQKYCGKAADDHIRQTRTGIVKGTFWKFYSAARRQAYTKQNIKSAFRKTGIHPFNPDAVLTLVTGKEDTPDEFDTVATESDTDMSQLLKTPRKNTSVRAQTQIAEEAILRGDKETALAVVRRFGHTTQVTLSTAEIRGVELADIHRQYAGKKAATTDRRVLTKARVIDGGTLMKLRDKREEADRLKAERAAANKRKKPTPKQPKKAKVGTILSSSNTPNVRS